MPETIVVLNPNSSRSVTEQLSEALEPMRFPGGPAIRCDTLSVGPPAIESDSDVLSVVAPVTEYVREHQEDTSAFVIACFSDPGLREARGVSARPVFGMAECGLLTALARGRTFGVISILETSIERHLRYIRAMGIDGRLAADLSLDMGVLSLGDTARALERMIAVGTRLRDEHGAEVLVMGCAGMAALREPLENALGVPIIEPVQAAVGMAIASLAHGAAPVNIGRVQ